MGKRLDRAIAEAEEIEAAESSTEPDAPLPDHVKASRPNRARSRVLQVRLNPDEMAAIEQIAERRALPVSTVAREQLLRVVEEERAAAGNRTTALIEHLLLLTSQLRDAYAADREAESSVSAG